MWKRILTGCSVMFMSMVVSILPLLFPDVSSAACGVDPPLPPEGFSWPASGPVISGWTLDCHSDRGHRGIDIAVSEGDPIVASSAGVVIFAGYTPAEGGGMTVSVEHTGGMRTTYLHLAQLLVSQGQTVSKGQQLGSSDGMPLHFGMKTVSPQEIYFDPVAWMPPAMASPSARDPYPATAEVEPGPASAASTAAGPPLTQESSSPATDMMPGLAVEPVPAVAGTQPEGQATSTGFKTASSSQMNSSSDPAKITIVQEDRLAEIMTNPAAAITGPLPARFDEAADRDQAGNSHAVRSPRQSSPISEGASPVRYLILAALLMAATAASGLARQSPRQKPASAC